MEVVVRLHCGDRTFDHDDHCRYHYDQWSWLQLELNGDSGVGDGDEIVGQDDDVVTGRGEGGTTYLHDLMWESFSN